ncbi:MAG: hypothetical protein AABX66_01170 [Nanoarchaeota archaeon]
MSKEYEEPPDRRPPTNNTIREEGYWNLIQKGFTKLARDILRGELEQITLGDAINIVREGISLSLPDKVNARFYHQQSQVFIQFMKLLEEEVKELSPIQRQFLQEDFMKIYAVYEALKPNY